MSKVTLTDLPKRSPPKHIEDNECGESAHSHLLHAFLVQRAGAVGAGQCARRLHALAQLHEGIQVRGQPAAACGTDFPEGAGGCLRRFSIRQSCRGPVIQDSTFNEPTFAALRLCAAEIDNQTVSTFAASS